MTQGPSTEQAETLTLALALQVSISKLISISISISISGINININISINININISLLSTKNSESSTSIKGGRFKKQAGKPRSYASLKLRPTDPVTLILTRVKSRAKNWLHRFSTCAGINISPSTGRDINRKQYKRQIEDKSDCTGSPLAHGHRRKHRADGHQVIRGGEGGGVACLT